MSTLTKKDFVDSVSTRTGFDREQVRQTLQVFLEQVIDRLSNGERIEFRDFGVFEVKQRAARIAQNPKTLQRVSVPARRTVKFKPGRLMKDIPVDQPPSPLPGPGSNSTGRSGNGKSREARRSA